MADRLVELYPVGSRVEIFLQKPDDTQHWQMGAVLEHDFPGVWVRTDEGQYWFITNNRNIRRPDVNAL